MSVPGMGVTSGGANKRRRGFFGGPELASLAGGFNAPAQTPGFWGGLGAGLAGSLGGAAQYAANTHEQEKQMLQQMMEERRLAIDQSRATEDERHNRATEAVAVAKEPDWQVPVQGPMQEGQQRPTMLYPGLEGIPQAGRQDAFNHMMDQRYPKPAAAVPILSDNALNMLAHQALDQGGIQWPGMGAAANVQRTRIAEREAALNPNANLAQNKAAFTADTASLKSLQGNYDQTSAFGKTAEKNAQVLTQTINAIPNLGTRFGNHVGRWAASQAGSPEVAKFHAALSVVTPEFNRILSFAGTGGNQRLSDSQEKDLKATLSGDFTPAQLQGALSVYFQDRDNKLNSYADQILAIRARIHKGGGQQQTGGGTATDAARNYVKSLGFK